MPFIVVDSLKVFSLILPCFLIVYPGLCRSSHLATFAALASLLFLTTCQGILTSSNESFLFRRQPIIAYNIHRLYMQGHTCSGFVRFLQLQRNCCKDLMVLEALVNGKKTKNTCHSWVSNLLLSETIAKHASLGSSIYQEAFGCA